MLEILEFCFRDFGTYLGVTLWILLIVVGICGFRLVEIHGREEKVDEEHGM